jgi:hypothetical protein
MPALAGGGRVGGQCDGMHFTPTRLASLGTLPLRGRDGVRCRAEQTADVMQ